MRSFVKPFARAKFGLAAASTAALMASPLGAMPANAAGFTVNACTASGPGSITAAIEASNSTSGPNTIDFEITADCTVTLAETLEVNESVTIQNDSDFEFELLADATLSGALLAVEGDGLTAEGVSLGISGIKFNGGSFSTAAPLLQAVSETYTADITVTDSVFTGATTSAIGVIDQLALAVSESDFYDNTGLFGGAISAYDTSLGVSGSDFYGNSALNGGAIDFAFSEERSMRVFESRFGANYAAAQGGAISVFAPSEHPTTSISGLTGDVLITGSFFAYNTANTNGGAIYASHSAVSLWGVNPYEFYYAGPGNFDINYQNSFIRNTANYGGAIASESGVLVSIGSYFTENTAQIGGAIYSTDIYGSPIGTSSALISYFDHFDSNDSTFMAGAVYARLHSVVTIAGSTVSNSQTVSGPAVYLNRNYVSYVLNSNFAYNTSTSRYPALYVSVGYGGEGALIAHNTFLDNDTSYSTSFTGVGVGSSGGPGIVFGNIFASSNPENYQFIETGQVFDAGANLFTGPVVRFDTADSVVPSFPASAEGGSVMVSWEQLDLQGLLVNDNDPANSSTWPTIALGPDSIARDYYDLESEGISLEALLSGLGSTAFTFDSRFVARIDDDGAPLYGDGFDVGAFELGWSLDETGTTPNLVITSVSKPTISAGGDTFSVYGRGLDDVTELYVAGVEVSFRVVSSTELAVTSGVLPVGAAEILAIATDGRASFQMGVAVTDEASYWTKNLGNGQAKIYAKNIVGEGKVQFFVNGREIAWINAVDETDPKLRKANGASYLVRTVNLVAGKNRLEVKVDGVRVRFTTYTR